VTCKPKQYGWSCLFSHLPTEEQFDSLQFGAITNKALIGIHLTGFVGKQVFIFWDKCLVVLMLSNMINLYLILKELLSYFAEWLCHFTCPRAVSERSKFSVSLPALGIIPILC
jgi:hypothetical protein